MCVRGGAVHGGEEGFVVFWGVVEEFEGEVGGLEAGGKESLDCCHCVGDGVGGGRWAG